MSDDTTTATVRTATAVVREVVADGRKITLSVYNQLDTVHADHIDPMGRVAPRDAEHGWVYVIGRHKKTSDLVRSSWPTLKGDIHRAALQASNYNTVRDALADAEKKLKNLVATAEQADEEAAVVLSREGYRSAYTQDLAVEEAEKKAADASDEVEKLGALADAATARYRAAQRRAEAHKAQDAATAARQEADECRLRITELQASLEDAAEAFQVKYREAVQLGHLWNALPLLVLAGLR